MEYYIYSKSVVKGYEAVRGLFGGGRGLKGLLPMGQGGA